MIEVTHTYKADSISFTLLMYEFSLTLNSQSEDKEAWTEVPTFFKSLDVVTRIFNQPTLTLRLLASLSVERKLSSGRARQSSFFNCSWDMIDQIYYKRKPLSDKVHLLVSLMVSRYLESNWEQIAFKSRETNESKGSYSVWVLSPSCSLEVACVKSSFS